MFYDNSLTISLWMVFIYVLLVIGRTNTYIIPEDPINSSLPMDSIYFATRYLFNESNLVVVGGFLINDLTNDGFADVYFATITGKVYGILNFLRCHTNSPGQTHSSNWRKDLSDEHFVSRPISVSQITSICLLYSLFISYFYVAHGH